MVTSQLAEEGGALVGSIYQFPWCKCSHHDCSITGCVAGPGLNSSGNQMTEKEVEAARQTDRWTDGARLRTLWDVNHFPQYSVSQIPGPVLPYPDCTRESSEGRVTKARIRGRQLLRISALAPLPRSRPSDTVPCGS